MISDLQPFPPAQSSSQGQPKDVTLHESHANELRASVVSFGHVDLVQPIKDIPAYLAMRTPQPFLEGEEALLITLPAKIQREVRALVRACDFVKGLIAKKLSVQRACDTAVKVFKSWNWNLKTFRAKFDAWLTSRDWLVLVNRAKAPACWRSSQTATGLPKEFLAFVETKFAAFKRSDGKSQALLAIKRQWRTGRNEYGLEEIIPGYEQVWAARDRENYPVGWHYSNILTQIKRRARFTPGVRALLHEGESAARALLPQVLGTRRSLRFLEKITFDDVRMDWLVFNTETGQAEELWLLVARDEATAMVLGFVMHPATVREDGSASHLGARQMKELAAYLLERYPLPPYTTHWVVERGTATLAEGVKAALGELFNNRIKVHYTSMIGALSATGYAEKKKGNSRGKASHESHNRLFHTQGSYLPGQTGAHYAIRPAQLDAQAKEGRECWELRCRLPADKQGDVKYPLVVLQTEAREVISKFCVEQNFRTDHKLEAFEQILEWWDEANQKWQLATAAPTTEVRYRTRMEMPVERALRLIRSVEKWDRVSPDIIRTFLEHTERRVEIEVNGEIKFTHDGKVLIFRAPESLALPPGTKCLAYHHPDDPQFLHLTSGDGRILGTWAQRGRGAYRDQEALAEALRYTHAARTTAMNTARELAAPHQARLDAMRENNAELVAGCEAFVVTAPVPDSALRDPHSAVGEMLAGAKELKREAKKQERQRADDERIAREALDL